MLDDQKLKRWTIGSMLFVALFAAVVSYAHIRVLALRNGYDQYTASALPFGVDGLLVGASFMLVTASRERLKAPLARFALWVGIGATLGANVAYGLPYGLVGATVSAWPGASFILIVEAFMQLAKRQRQKSKPPKPVIKPEPTKRTKGAINRLERGGYPAGDTTVNKLPPPPTTVSTNGHVPTIREIKAKANCGVERATSIQNLIKQHHISIEQAADLIPRKTAGRKPNATQQARA